MPSVFALRVLFAASLGLGALDLVWINVALAPELVGREASVSSVAPAPAPVPESAPAPAVVMPDPAPAVEVQAPAAPRMERVHFATGSAALDRAARQRLRELVQGASGDVRFALEGHADHRGHEAFNRSLSRRRALAVASYLRRLGVPDARVEVSFAGADHASNERELWRDRRVDIQIQGGP